MSPCVDYVNLAFSLVLVPSLLPHLDKKSLMYCKRLAFRISFFRSPYLFLFDNFYERCLNGKNTYGTYQRYQRLTFLSNAVVTFMKAEQTDNLLYHGMQMDDI